MGDAPQRPSELVPASRDALEMKPRRTGTGRKTAADRIPGNGMSEEPFNRGVGLPHVHRAISLRQSLDHGPLDHPVAETTHPRHLRLEPGAADLLRNTAQKCIENARKRW